MELETKLVLLPGASMDVPTVLAAASSVARLVGGPPARHLVAPYFDTPDGLLRAAMWTLRCRTADGVPVATIKGPGPRIAGVFARVEHELTLPTPAREGDPLPPGLAAPLHAAGLDLARWPSPMFTTDVRRTLADLDVDGARLELAIDVGQAVTASARAPIAEVELELKAGSPDALLATAHALAERLPVRPGGRAKAARGLQLLGLLEEPAPPPSDADAASLWDGLCELEERRREGDERWAADHERLCAALGIEARPGEDGWVRALWRAQERLTAS